MQFKRVLPISDPAVALKKTLYQHRTPALIQKQHVQEFENSGLKQIEFCKQHNIRYSTFANWWRRHRSEQATVDQSIVPDSPVVMTTSKEALTKESRPTFYMTCTLPNGLNIALSPVGLVDLPELIEVLSICKLN
jgi:transposase-like protein